MKIIEKLQNKPRHIRVMIMWLAVSVCMVFLISVWVWSFNAQVKKNEVPRDISQDQSTVKFNNQINQIPTLWQSLKAGISDLFESEYIQENQNSINSVPPEVNLKAPSGENQEKVPAASLP